MKQTPVNKIPDHFICFASVWDVTLLTERGSGSTGTCLGRTLSEFALDVWMAAWLFCDWFLPFCSPMPAFPDAWGLCVHLQNRSLLCHTTNTHTSLPEWTSRLSYTSAVDLWLHRGLWLNYCLSGLPLRGPAHTESLSLSGPGNQ